MVQITSDRIEVTVTPDTLQVAPGGRGLVVLAVTNRGRVVDQFDLRVEGIDPSWCTIVEHELSLFPDAGGTLSFEIHPPEIPAPAAGSHVFQAVVASRDDPTSATVVRLTLDVLTVGGIEMLLTPQRVAIRQGWARFVVDLHNTSNAPHSIGLKAIDPDDALEFKVDGSRVDLSSEADHQAALLARPRRRPLVAAPHDYVFRVLALPVGADVPEAAEPLAGVDGVLQFQPALAFLAAIPMAMRRRLIVLAIALAALAVVLWFLGQPGSPFARPQPTPTPEVALPAKPAPQPAAAAAPAQEPTQPPTAVPTQVPVLPTTASVPKPALPNITRFDLAVPPDGARGDFVLRWEVSGADSVKIGGQPKPTSGSEALQEVTDSDIELEAINAGGTVKQTIGIVVLKPPEIQALAASATLVNSGDPVTLTWKARRAERASLAGQEVNASQGSLEVRPDRSTIYTLIAENELGRVRRGIEIDVRGSPPPQSESSAP
jgi:hypothetical protein